MSVVLKVEGLYKRFGGLQVLNGVDMEINSEEIVGLIGPNGCGKSTTYNLISGILPMDAGKVTLFDHEISNLRSDQINHYGLSRTYQNTRLWRQLTVIENLIIPPKNQNGTNIFNTLFNRKKLRAEERELVTKAYETLDFLEISHMANNYASELSGGQSKLVDLGRVLMSDPQILLLDEPVAGVAGPLAEKIFRKIEELRDEKGLSIVIIEHNMDFILQTGVDRVYVMSNGKIVASGDPKEIRNKQEVIDAYLGE